MDKKKKSVLVPIIFFNFFNFPLTLKELRRYLWRCELSLEEIQQIIKQLPGVQIREDLIYYDNHKLDRDLKEKIAGKFWGRVACRRWIFSNVPFIKQVFVSNTLAYNNVHHNSDIDIFIVGQKGRLWTARAFLLLEFNLFGWRVRSINRYGKFSPEFFVSEAALNLRKVVLDNDYYLSFWLADLVSIWPDSESTLLKRANYWFKEDLPIAWRSPKIKPFTTLKPSYFRLLMERFLSGKWGDILEEKLHSIQSRIIQHNLKRLGVNPEVVVNKDIIKLHFNDRRAEVRDVIEKRIYETLENT